MSTCYAKCLRTFYYIAWHKVLVACRPLDAALVSPGKRTPFPSLDPESVDMTGGMSFCLANNIWGTNCMGPFYSLLIMPIAFAALLHR